MEHSIMIDYNIICIGQRESTIFCPKFQTVNKLYPEFPSLEYIRGVKYRYTFDYDEQIDLTEDSYTYFYCKRETECAFIKNSAHYYLQKSPINKIMVLFRLQLDQKERIAGEITLKQFIKRLDGGKLRPNYAYLITE